MGDIDRKIENYTEIVFEKIKIIDENSGIELWSARDLQIALEYAEWRNFIKIINKAKVSCKLSGLPINDHFVEVNKMVTVGSQTSRDIEDLILSRYACYLIVQNGDPSKSKIALGQTYFAKATRENELLKDFDFLPEDEKRLQLREDIKHHNKSLAEAASLSGITQPIDYAIFQNKGYQGLYGGLDNREIKSRKGLKRNDNILDYMGSTELAANLFRATQTDDQLRKRKINNKKLANDLHYNVGKKVRETIIDLEGTLPEDMETPRKSIKELEKNRNKLISEKNTNDE